VISEPVGANIDITNAPPPAGVQVVPPGGTWNTPTLVVTVTLTAAFMTALGIGTHHFYMTGVSQRGLSNFIQMILTVS